MGNDLTKTPTTPEETDRKNTLIGIIVGVFIGFFLLILICVLVERDRRKNRKEPYVHNKDFSREYRDRFN